MARTNHPFFHFGQFIQIKTENQSESSKGTVLKSKRLDIGAAVIILACLLGFCQDLVFNGEVPFYRDLTNYFYPLRFSLSESLRANDLGLWNRQFAQGFPNLASFQTGVFYLPHWTFLLLPFYATIRVLFVFHFLVAAWGSYMLLRRWHYSHDLAIVGALLFSLGGVMVSLTNLLNHFQSAVWLPWLLIAWERLLFSPRWRYFLEFTLIAAMQFLAGSPEITALSMCLALVKGFSLVQSDKQASSCRMIGFAIAGNILMLCLIMVQVMPTMELILESRRGYSIPVSESLMWSLEPQSLFNLFFPDNEVDRSIGVGIVYYFGRKIPLFLSMYLGLICLYGIALWICYAERRERIILSFLVLMSLALALGGNAPVYPFFFDHLPFLSAIRFPEKFFFIANALLIVFAMSGLRSFLMDDSKRIRGALIILGMMCLTWLGLYLYLNFRSEIISNFIALSHRDAVISKGVGHLTVGVLTNLQRQVILSFAIFFLLLLIKIGKLRPVLFSVLLVAVVYVDLTWAHKSYLFPIHPEKLLATPPMLERAQTQHTRLFYYPSANDLHPAYFTVQGQPTFEQAVALSYQNLLPNVGTLYGMDYFQEIDALGRRGYSDFLRVANGLPFEQQIKLLSTFNVKHVVSFRELPEKYISLVRRFPEYLSWLYEIKTVVPRAYMVTKLSVEKESAKIFQRLSATEFDPLREVVLDANVLLAPMVATWAKVDIQRYENSAVTMATVSNGESILVLADSFYPGWKAYVDGTQTAIFRANYFYRAVRLPGGKHQVEFRYEPTSFKIGAIISLATLLFIILISISVCVRQRKRVPCALSLL